MSIATLLHWLCHELFEVICGSFKLLILIRWNEIFINSLKFGFDTQHRFMNSHSFGVFVNYWWLGVWNYSSPFNSPEINLNYRQWQIEFADNRKPSSNVPNLTPKIFQFSLNTRFTIISQKAAFNALLFNNMIFNCQKVDWRHYKTNSD